MSMRSPAAYLSGYSLLMTVIILVAQSTVCAAVELTFKSETVEFVAGAEKNGETVSFPFANKSNETITIQDIQTGCGCMKAELQKRRYEPGEVGTLSIYVDFHERSGPLRKKVKVAIVGNDPASKREQQLQINGTVLSPFKFSALILAWKVGEAPKSKTISITRNAEIAIDQIKIEPSSPTSPFSSQEKNDENGNIIITLTPNENIIVDEKIVPLDGSETQHAYYVNYRHIPSNTQKRERFFAIIHR